MGFEALPPEVISALIHSGPGPGSLTAAAAAWGQLATHLDLTADGWNSVITGLNGVWRGPSAGAMRAAGAAQITWLRSTAGQASQFGRAAQQAAAAFDAARAAITTPAEVAANRAQLTQLVATNLLGQNTMAIAATQAQYEAMWARNTAAMNSYRAVTSQATGALTPVDPPPAIAGVTPAAVAAADPPATPLGTLASLLPSLGAPTTGDLLSTLVGYTGGELGSFPWSMLQVLAQFSTAQGTNATANNIGEGLGAGLGAIGGGGGGFGALGGGAGPGALGAASASASVPITATLGKGVPIGGLTAPPTAANVRLVSQTAPLSGTPDFGGPILAPPMVPRTRPTATTDKKWKTGRELPAVTPKHPAGG